MVLLLVFLLPESKILLEQLNDRLGIAKIILLELINFVKSLLEGLIGELTGSLVVLHDFLMEDRKFKGKTELDGVVRGKCDLVGLVVSFEGLNLDTFELVGLSVFSDVAVVVTDHLDEEGSGLIVAFLGEDLRFNDVNDALVVTDELSLNAGLVEDESVGVLGVLGVLLNCMHEHRNHQICLAPCSGHQQRWL